MLFPWVLGTPRGFQDVHILFSFVLGQNPGRASRQCSASWCLIGPLRGWGHVRFSRNLREPKLKTSRGTVHGANTVAQAGEDRILSASSAAS